MFAGFLGAADRPRLADVSVSVLVTLVGNQTATSSNLSSPTLRETPRPRYLWPPVLAYMAFIFTLSSISQVPALPGGGDKNLHALLYAGLGVAAGSRARRRTWRRRVTIGAVVAPRLRSPLRTASATRSISPSCRRARPTRWMSPPTPSVRRSRRSVSMRGRPWRSPAKA